MGFYPQPNEWSCGPFALKHALVALGKLAEADEIARFAKTHWWSGTDELRLARAARAYDCALVGARRRDPELARRALVRSLASGRPAILCVDDWGHWITVLRHHGGEFVVVDSNMDPVLNVLSWQTLRRRWRYLDVDYDEDEPPALFDYFEVVPKFRAVLRGQFSVSRVRFLRRAENRRLALCWDEFLEDLLEICRPRSPQHVAPLSMAEFLRRHQEMLLRRVEYWHGDIARRRMLRLFSHLRFVAETYGLVIPEAAQRRALADLAILATMWAVAEKGLGPIYEPGAVKGP